MVKLTFSQVKTLTEVTDRPTVCIYACDTPLTYVVCMCFYTKFYKTKISQ